MVTRISSHPIQFRPNLIVRTLANLFQLIARYLFGNNNTAPAPLSQRKIERMDAIDELPPPDSLSLEDIQWVDPIEWAREPIVKRMRATAAVPHMNFPHAYDDISAKALIGALNRVIKKSHNKNLSNELIKLKNEVEENGLPKNSEKLSEDFNTLKNDVIKWVEELNFEKSSYESIVNFEKSKWFKDSEVIKINEDKIVSCENEINRLNEIKVDLLAVIYYLRPNALMTMRPSVVKMTTGSNAFKETFEIYKQNALIQQGPYNHTKIVSGRPKESGSVQPSVRRRIMGLPIGKPKVSASSFRSEIAQANSASERTAKRDPRQPLRGQLASVPRSVLHEQDGEDHLLDKDNFKLIEEEQRRTHEAELGAEAWAEKQKKLMTAKELPLAFVQRMQKKFPKPSSSAIS